MRYTENFKKQVVRKALSTGVIQADLCRKLGVSISALQRWKALYSEEVRDEVVEVDIASILVEDEVDIDLLLRRAEQKSLEEDSGSTAVAARIDQLGSSGKDVAAYNHEDKYAMVRAVRSLDHYKRMPFLRKFGLCERHITQWEEELIKMSKHQISNDERIKALEEENKRLKKQLEESDRDKHELEVLIELKKKYHQLFEPDEEQK